MTYIAVFAHLNRTYYDRTAMTGQIKAISNTCIRTYFEAILKTISAKQCFIEILCQGFAPMLRYLSEEICISEARVREPLKKTFGSFESEMTVQVRSYNRVHV